MKTAAVLQPGYLPWLGFFEQLHRSDVFVFYDDAQYTTNDWRNRNRIKADRGPAWLTVPVERRFPMLISEARIDDHSPWRKKHIGTLKQYYARAPYFEEVFSFLEEGITRSAKTLLDLDVDLVRRVMGYLGLKREIRFSSELGVPGSRSEKLAGICRKLGAARYYSGASAREYLDVSIFQKEGIEVVFQDYRHPVYRQIHGEFVPHLSVVDLLFNEGPASLDILVRGGSEV